MPTVNLWNKKIIAEKLNSFLATPVLVDEPMSSHTSWKIGGKADFFLAPHSTEELQNILLLAQKWQMPFFVMGNGSNLLVSDQGIRGLVIKIGDNMSAIEWQDNTVLAQAGALLATVSHGAAKRGLAGLEFAAGIPGSVGGAIIMNAGAYGSNISQFVTKVECLEYNGKKRVLDIHDLYFSYRESSFSQMDAVVTNVYFQLPTGNKEASQEQIRQLLALRSSKQPLEYPSAGSVFRNPEHDHAGRLVEVNGCCGLTVGGAQVSAKHGNFIINLGNATARDVLDLIELVRTRVQQSSGVYLETEVKMVGEQS